MSAILKIFYCFEAMPFIISLFYWAKVKNNYFKWFAIYLFYIFIADIGGSFIDRSITVKYNEIYYDYFVIPVEFLFLFWLFHKTFQFKENKRLPIICAGMYLFSFLVDVFYFSKHQFPFYSFSYSIGNLLLLILILLFFIQLTNSDAILNYRQDMMFWICLGLLIYYLGTCPYYGLKNTFAYKYKKIRDVYNRIALVLDCIMYLRFTFSFIWGKPNLQSSRS